MFYGSIPTKCLEQIHRIVDFNDWEEVFVSCSGSFKIEQFLSIKYPSIPIHSNDVSLWSSAIAATILNSPIQCIFKNELEFIEKKITGESWLTRAAAVLVAQEMSRLFTGKNRYAATHLNYYKENFETFLDNTCKSLYELTDTLKLSSYQCCSWENHIDAAIDQGFGAIAFPPFFKGDYELQYKFLESNVEWSKPEYKKYNPDDLEVIIRKLEDSGLPFLILSDQHFKDREAVLCFSQGRKASIYGYGRLSPRTTYRNLSVTRSQPFLYNPVSLPSIRKDAVISVVWTDNQHANYIKDIYLAKTIKHTNGPYCCFILLDEMLLACLIFRLDTASVKKTSDATALYLLTDVVTCNDFKLAKLAALIATSRTLLRHIERKELLSVNEVWTTARTSNPVSMKYRGGYKLFKRESNSEGNVLHYVSVIREETPQDLYNRHYLKYQRELSAAHSK